MIFNYIKGRLFSLVRRNCSKTRHFVRIDIKIRHKWSLDSPLQGIASVEAAEALTGEAAKAAQTKAAHAAKTRHAAASIE